MSDLRKTESFFVTYTNVSIFYKKMNHGYHFYFCHSPLFSFTNYLKSIIILVKEKFRLTAK